MEIKVQMPFQQLLNIVKNLSAAQKARLRQELEDRNADYNNQEDFINYLLNGPIYCEEEIKVIQETAKALLHGVR